MSRLFILGRQYKW